MNNSEKHTSRILEILSQNLEKISNALLLNSLMNYRKNIEDRITNTTSSKAKKAVWDLCNGSNNNTDISKILKKSRSTISEHIQAMVAEKIVFEILRGKEKYPISIDSLIDLLIVSSIST